MYPGNIFLIFIATDKRRYPHNIFLISQQKHMLWYSLEVPHQGASNEYPQHMFSSRNKKDISIFQMKKVPYLLLCYNIATKITGDSPVPWTLYTCRHRQ